MFLSWFHQLFKQKLQWKKIPTDVVNLLPLYIPIEDLYRCRYTNKHWYKIYQFRSKEWTKVGNLSNVWTLAIEEDDPQLASILLQHTTGISKRYLWVHEENFIYKHTQLGRAIQEGAIRVIRQIIDVEIKRTEENKFRPYAEVLAYACPDLVIEHLGITCLEFYFVPILKHHYHYHLRPQVMERPWLIPKLKKIGLIDDEVISRIKEIMDPCLRKTLLLAQLRDDGKSLRYSKLVQKLLAVTIFIVEE